MAVDITFVNQGQSILLQAFKGVYFSPKQELDLQQQFPKYQNMNLAQLKNLVQTDFINNFENENGEKVVMYEDKGVEFHFRDGKSDVYTKGGYDFQVFEYLERQLGESQKWRIETNETYIDFKAGGKIIVGDREFIILKVLTIITSGTTPNKFLAMDTPKGFERFAPKILAIV
jgi:hypothetical protein